MLEDWILRKNSCSWNSQKTVGKSSIFVIPTTVFDQLPSVTTPDSSEKQELQSITSFDSDSVSGKTCLACQLTFETHVLQREHFKTDLHSVNLKRRLRNLIPLQQCEFETLSLHDEGLNTNTDIDNSDDCNQSGSDDDDVSETVNDSVNTSAFCSIKQDFEVQSPYGSCIKLSSNKYGHQVVYRRTQEQKWEIIFNTSACTIDDASHSNDPWTSLNQLSNISRTRDEQMWGVFILRSGRFAAAIFLQHKIIVHKVFRRYTVRAKAGGSQSSYDNQGGKAQSMGAMLRRHGEQALKEDVQELLLSWSSHIQTCCKLILSIPKTMHSVLFEYNNLTPTQPPPLRKSDSRICYVPFMVGKPTLEEVKTIHDRCTTVIFRSIKPHSKSMDSDSSAQVGSDVRNGSANIDWSHMEEDLKFYESNKSEIFGLSPVNELDAFSSTFCPHGSTESNDVPLQVGSTTAIIRTDKRSLPKCKFSERLIQACLSGNVKEASKIITTLHQSSETSVLRNYDDDNNDDDNNDDDEEVGKVENLPADLRDLAGSSLPHSLESENIASTAYDVCSDIAMDLKFVINLPDSLDSLQSPLHIASELGHHKIVRLLLLYGANPCQVDVRNRTAYNIAKDKITRDTFRWVRGMNEEKWNWDKAGVGPSLNQAIEAIQKEKEKEKKKKQRDKKKAEKVKADNEKAEKLRLLAAQREHEEDEKKKLMERLSAPCDNCGKSMLGVTAMLLFDKRCCSATCSIAIRRKLSAEAALSRLNK